MDFGTVFPYGPPLEGINDFTRGAGLVTLTCVGLPGTQYSVERATELQQSAAWTPIGTTNAPPDGRFALIDTTPPPVTAFYRLRR